MKFLPKRGFVCNRSDEVIRDAEKLASLGGYRIGLFRGAAIDAKVGASAAVIKRLVE